MLASFFDYQHAHKDFFSSQGDKFVYKKGQYLVMPQEESPWVYFLLDGYVSASFGFYDGTERLLGFFVPGMSFAKVGSFFGREDGNIEYAATTKVTVYRVKRQLFLQELTKNPAFNAEYLNWLLKVQILLIERVVLLGQPTMKLKIVHWLEFMHKYYGETAQGNCSRIALPLTHEVIGNFVHATRESVGKVLRELEDSGIIRTEKKHITICDLPDFKKLLT